MQFIVENKINKAALNKAQAALFLLVSVKNNQAAKYGKFYDLLSLADKKIKIAFSLEESY